MQWNKSTMKNMPDLFAYFGYNDFEFGAMGSLLALATLVTCRFYF